MFEGIFSDDKDDKGGATKYGISLELMRSLNPQAMATDIMALTMRQAEEIYERVFWRPAYDLVPQNLAIRVFDIAVTSGQSDAAKCLQRALRACGHESIIDDGIIGGKTLAAVAITNTEALVASFRSEAAAHYRLVAAADNTQRKFLAGWLRRAYSKT